MSINQQDYPKETKTGMIRTKGGTPVFCYNLLLYGYGSYVFHTGLRNVGLVVIVAHSRSLLLVFTRKAKKLSG